MLAIIISYPTSASNVIVFIIVINQGLRNKINLTSCTCKKRKEARDLLVFFWMLHIYQNFRICVDGLSELKNINMGVKSFQKRMKILGLKLLVSWKPRAAIILTTKKLWEPKLLGAVPNSPCDSSVYLIYGKQSLSTVLHLQKKKNHLNCSLFLFCQRWGINAFRPALACADFSRDFSFNFCVFSSSCLRNWETESLMAMPGRSRRRIECTNQDSILLNSNNKVSDS